MSSRPWARPYVESTVFISWLRGEAAEGENAKISSHLLGMGDLGRYKIITSYLTLVEVFKKKGDGKERLTDEQNGRALKYFENSFLVFVELDRIVAEEANRLCVQYRSEKLSPCDAIHLASALRAKCDYLLTWDGPLCAIKHRDIKIEHPRIVGQGEIDFENG